MGSPAVVCVRGGCISETEQDSTSSPPRALPIQALCLPADTVMLALQGRRPQQGEAGALDCPHCRRRLLRLLE